MAVGGFVTEGIALATYWVNDDADPDRVASRLRESIGVGSSRTMQEDVSFGLRQLIDIGLRALSPGVNDPTTAIEVLVHVGGVMSHLLTRQLPPRVMVDDDGRVLVAVAQPDASDYVDQAFDQMRLAAATQPAVLGQMASVIGQVATLVSAAGFEHRTTLLRAQIALLLDTAESADHLPYDLERVRRAAHATGLLEQPAEVDRTAGTAD